MRVLPNLSHALLAALLLLVAQAALATEITGRVVGITDGDTLTVLNEARQQVRVRLAEIDTPEARQPYGNRARQALSDRGGSVSRYSVSVPIGGFSAG